MIAWVTIVINKPHDVVQEGVTSDLKVSIAKHEARHYPNSLTARYNADRILLYARIDDMMNAIKREKQLKAANRARTVKCIGSINPDRKDLSADLR